MTSGQVIDEEIHTRKQFQESERQEIGKGIAAQ
jgi:hypothetical protein